MNIIKNCRMCAVELTPRSSQTVLLERILQVKIPNDEKNAYLKTTLIQIGVCNLRTLLGNAWSGLFSLGHVEKPGKTQRSIGRRVRHLDRRYSGLSFGKIILHHILPSGDSAVSREIPWRPLIRSRQTDEIGERQLLGGIFGTISRISSGRPGKRILWSAEGAPQWVCSGTHHVKVRIGIPKNTSNMTELG